jgi:hypothetical protein
MPSTPIALIDTLNELLDAEQTSLLRFMGEGYPYLNRATVEVRRPLEEMVSTIDGRVGRLADQIERLGGVPNLGPRGIDREEQYLAFLSLKFLLPKLVDAKKLLIERYENAIRAIKSNSEAKALLSELLEAHQAQLNILRQAASRVASQK